MNIVLRMVKKMNKIKSFEELIKIRDDIKEKTRLRTLAENPERIILSVGIATCGIAAGARDTIKALNEEIAKNNLNNVSVITTGCLGYCYAEPVVEVRIPGVEPILYGRVDSNRASKIITEHVLGGRMLDNAIIGRGELKNE